MKFQVSQAERRPVAQPSRGKMEAGKTQGVEKECQARRLFNISNPLFATSLHLLNAYDSSHVCGRNDMQFAVSNQSRVFLKKTKVIEIAPFMCDGT